MKHLIVLPGNSPKNEAWGSVCADHFASEFDEVTVQSYTHWQSGEPVIDFEVEKATLAATVEASPEATWFVFAKSAGTILALEAVAAGIITPKQCVFFGMPLDLAAEDLYSEDWSSLDSFSVPTLAFHNEYDPVAAYAFTKVKTDDKPNIELVTLPGDTHDYDDFSQYKVRVAEFLGL